MGIISWRASSPGVSDVRTCELLSIEVELLNHFSSRCGGQLARRMHEDIKVPDVDYRERVVMKAELKKFLPSNY